jgi:hypothetical protein
MGTRARFILRYTGDGPAPAGHVARLRDVPGTQVIDQSDRMLLVEGDSDDLERAARALGTGWVLTPEKTVPVPDPKKKIERGSG